MEIEIQTSLQTERLGNRLWVLLKPFRFSVDQKQYTVPAGFVTDGASSPRWLWPLCAPVSGPFGEAAVAHDYLYAPEGPRVRQYYADSVLSAIGIYRKANPLVARVVKVVVNTAGKRYFKIEKDKLTPQRCYDALSARERVARLKEGRPG